MPEDEAPPGSRAVAHVEQRLREATREPNQIAQQFERYAAALERQSAAAIRRAQEEQKRAMDQLTRQSALSMQQLSKSSQLLQLESSVQQKEVVRQNAGQLATLTARIDHFMDRSSKSFQEGLQAQAKANELLLTQIAESWQKGERERARQLEQLLVKQRALSQACEASSVAARREPRTEQLNATLRALRQTQADAAPEVNSTALREISTVLLFNASLTEALGAARVMLEDASASAQQHAEARRRAAEIIEGELRDQSMGRAEAFGSALKPAPTTATRLDMLATTRKGNPAAWRDVVESTPGQALV
jgi:hypothetical protein